MQNEARLPGTDVLEGTRNSSELVLHGLNQFLDQARLRNKKCRDEELRNPPARDELVDTLAGKRRELSRILGVVDARLPLEALEFVSTTKQPAQIAEAAAYTVHSVRWPVLEGVYGEGLYLKPKGTPIAYVVALGDADWNPRDLAGVGSGLPTDAQYARHLAEMGCAVVVPALIDRDCTWSGNPNIRMTNQPHREFVYRMAYQMGRHLIGYEVQKVLALVDLFSMDSAQVPVFVFGYGEGGLLALNSAALDERIAGAGVSGYFRDRFGVWQEPIYRNVWRLLRGFSDAELAAMIAPRPLVIEASCAPSVLGPPEPSEERQGAAPGVIATPGQAEVEAEVELARHTYAAYGAAKKLSLVIPPGGKLGTPEALLTLLKGGGVSPSPATDVPVTVTHDLGAIYDLEQQRRQFEQLCEYTQLLWRRSAKVREQFWDKADMTSVQSWEETTQAYREYFWQEVIGKCPDPTPSLRAKSRRIEEQPTYDVYELFVHVWDEVEAFAYLLVPKDIKPGERRPVMVCQHGLGGNPQGLLRRSGYKGLARRLAEQGYVALAPQNPSIGPAGDRFRVIERKANPLGWSLFSFITAFHQQWLTFLAQLPFVDAERIGFYGLSYGGKTAIRVPALLPGYRFSVCSGDFNEWIMKTVSTEFFSSYMFTGEYEVFEFDLGHTFNHAEMAYLIAPRPFMVERGTDDPCGTDDWVSFEYAKVRRLYLKLGISERTHMEVFDGGHQIHFHDAAQFVQTFFA